MNGEDLIKKYEGCRLVAYKCPAGVWTIGWGATRRPDGTPVRSGDEITQLMADTMLTDYLMKEVNPYIAKVKVPMTEGQRGALQSLIYNWNGSGFLKSKLFAAINAKDWPEVFRQWDFGIKNNLKGLLKRRSEELYLFLKDI